MTDSNRLNRQAGGGRSSLLLAVALLVALAGAINQFLADAESPDGGSTSGPETVSAPGVQGMHGAGSRKGADSGDAEAETTEPSSQAALLRHTTGSSAPRPQATPTTASESGPRLRRAPSRPYPRGQEPALPEEIYQDETAIAGRVVSEGGDPIEGVLVTIEPRSLFDPAAEAARSTGSDLSTVSDAMGFFAFRQLESGVYWLRADPAFDYEKTMRAVRAGVHSADLVLKRNGEVWIHGVVTDTDGRPLEGVLAFQGDRPAQQGLTDMHGAYALPLAVGERTRSASLRFRREDYREEEILVSAAEWEATVPPQVDVALEPLGEPATVHGTLMGTDGDPVIGERVQLISPAVAGLFQASSDADGRFVLPEVPSDTEYLVIVRPQGPYEDYEQRGFKVRKDGPDLSIRLRPRGLGAVSGHVMDTAGNPIPGFSLTVRSRSAMSVSRRITADASGDFYVDDVPAGELMFESHAYPSLSVRGVRLRPDAEKDVVLVLDWGDHRLSGYVRDSGGEAVPAARVWVSLNQRSGGVQTRSTRVTTADANGYFAFTGLGPGTHQVRVDAPGFESKSVQHRVSMQEEKIQVRLSN
jgi:protocatechuate 3,4-dioxygenase beta subunit